MIYLKQRCKVQPIKKKRKKWMNVFSKEHVFWFLHFSWPAIYTIATYLPPGCRTWPGVCWPRGGSVRGHGGIGRPESGRGSFGSSTACTPVVRCSRLAWPAGQREREAQCRALRVPGGSRLLLRPYHPERAWSHLISRAHIWWWSCHLPLSRKAGSWGNEVSVKLNNNRLNWTELNVVNTFNLSFTN